MKDQNLYIIKKAQEFINENQHVDVSRVQSLLRKIMSPEYHDLTDLLHGNTDTSLVFNISGGNNLIAPNATTIKQIIYVYMVVPSETI